MNPDVTLNVPIRPGGISGEAQFNLDGAFRGASFMTWSDLLQRLNITGTVVVSDRVGVGVAAPASRLETYDTATTTARGIVATQHTNLGAGASLVARRAREAAGAFAAVQSGDPLANFSMHGFDGAAFAFGALLQAFATENWTTAARGTRVDVRYTQPGTITLVDGARFAEPADTEIALLVRRNVGGTLSLQRVSMGAVDSGGVGFKVLRVPN